MRVTWWADEAKIWRESSIKLNINWHVDLFYTNLYPFPKLFPYLDHLILTWNHMAVPRIPYAYLFPNLAIRIPVEISIHQQTIIVSPKKIQINLLILFFLLWVYNSCKMWSLTMRHSNRMFYKSRNSRLVGSSQDLLHIIIRVKLNLFRTYPWKSIAIQNRMNQ